MEIKRGGFRPGIEISRDYTEYLADGIVPSNAVQRSAVKTVGTVATEVFSKLIDPGYNMQLKRIQAHFIQQFTGVAANTQASYTYYWQGRYEYFDGPVGTNRTGEWMALTATYTNGVATLGSAEATLSGLFPAGSLPIAPIRVRLMATALVQANSTGEVNAASFIRLVGNVIPST